MRYTHQPKIALTGGQNRQSQAVRACNPSPACSRANALPGAAMAGREEVKA